MSSHFRIKIIFYSSYHWWRVEGQRHWSSFCQLLSFYPHTLSHSHHSHHFWQLFTIFFHCHHHTTCFPPSSSFLHIDHHHHFGHYSHCPYLHHHHDHLIISNCFYQNIRTSKKLMCCKEIHKITSCKVQYN